MNKLQDYTLGILSDVIAEAAENNKKIRRFSESSIMGQGVPPLQASNENLARITESLCSVLRGETPPNEEPDSEVWEWGTIYEATGNPKDDVYEPASSEEAALSRVGESPTDTGLVRRRPAGPWKAVG